MTVPVVQGTAVSPGGGYAPPTQQYQHHSASPNTPYVSTGDGTFNTFQSQNNALNQQGGAQDDGRYRDPVWAVAFIVHLVVMIAIIVINMTSSLAYDNGHASNLASSYTGMLWLAFVSAVVAVAVASFSLGFMMKHATVLVKISLYFSVAMSGFIGILGLLSGQVYMAVMGLIMFAVGICYAWVVWSRIPFAAANLSTALTAVRANMGLALIAYLSCFLAIGWSMLWLLGVGRAASTENVVVLFLLLLSYYWVHQVITNTVHVTTAGAIGTWWFVPDEASSWNSLAIRESFGRATTTSFGSICMGSLLLALVQALRTTRHIIRDNDDCNIVACLIDCILSCLESIIEYLNKWAYVYVGLYGFPYVEAAKNVLQLFEHKGWTVVVTDDLVDNVLSLVSLSIGLLTGLVSLALSAADPNLLAEFGYNGNTHLAGFVVGFVVGFVISSVLMSVVASAVNTVIVCFAESPGEFQTNHPELSAEMRSAWLQAWPSLNI